MNEREQEIRERLAGISREEEVAHGLVPRTTDMDLILKAPADLAYLLAEVDRLRTELAEMTAEREHLHKLCVNQGKRLAKRDKTETQTP